MISSALRAVERLLLPNACVACGRAVESATPDALACAVCRSRLTPVPPGCARCRQPVPPVGPCRFCLGWPEVLKWATSAVWLGDEAREIVHHLKYEGYARLAVVAAEVIDRIVPRAHDALLVPIPLGARRMRDRGYNQAAAIAQTLGERWSCQVDENLLRRVRNTESQTALTPEERAANVAGAFEATRRPTPQRVAPSPSGTPTVILIDDVFTTGATLASAAKALQDAGWVEVGAVTFARAMPFALRLDARRG